MPPHTLVIAKKSTRHTTVSVANAVFTRAFSWRRVNAFKPRRYNGRMALTARSRKPESE